MAWPDDSITYFPNGIDATPLSQGGTATYSGVENIVNGAGTITTPLTTVQGFDLAMRAGVVPGGTVAVGDAAFVSGSATGATIVVGTFSRGGTAMASGTVPVYWHAWGV